MARYAQGLSKAGVNTASTTMWLLRAPTRKFCLVELGMFVEVAPTTAPTFGLYRVSALGTQTVTSAFASEDPDATTATATADTTFSVVPTLAATPLRRIPLPSTIGAGAVLTWPEDKLVVLGSAAATSGLAIVNINASGATTGTLSFYAVIVE